MKTIDKAFWDRKYLSLQTGWDIGYPSPPIVEYMKGDIDKSSRILIPGAGNAYEASSLYNYGFKDMTVLDISSLAINKLKTRLDEKSMISLIEGDFFDHDGKYDIIIEQTFFCALHPSLRNNYVEHMYSLLSDNGYIVGVLFDNDFQKQGPPFGGNKKEYVELFSSHFNIKYMDPCYNSILPRKGSELFIKLLKKTTFR